MPNGTNPFEWDFVDEPMIGSYAKKMMEELKKQVSEDGTVILYNGKVAKIEDAVYVQGEYYLPTDNLIVKDYFTNSFFRKESCGTIHVNFKEDGTIDYDKKDYYHNNGKIPFLVEINDGKHHVISDYNKVPKDFYTECILRNVFYHESIKKLAVTKKQIKIKGRKTNNVYDPSYNKSDLKKDYEMGVLSPSYVKTEGKKYTYGLEMETISGCLPGYVDTYLNYLSIYDGSLKDENGETYGLEYVTGILTGDTGLLQTKKLCNELTKRCLVDRKCGIHIHLGGTLFNSELIVYLYKLSQMVEKELFNMMPLSRRNNEYCKKLKKFKLDFIESDFNNPIKYKSLIENYYNQIYRYVAAREELPSSKYNKKTQHPLGAKCGYNHNTARYCWMNFVPTIFDTRGNGHNTIENRLMAGSTDFSKIKNWILINMGLLWFAENHKKYIALNSTIDLSYIMELAYPKTHREINEYIRIRTEKFSTEDLSTNKQIELSDYNEEVESNDLTIKNL